jgi:hypothetical protein
MSNILGKRKHQPTFEPVEAWIEELALKIDEIADEDVVIQLETSQCTSEEVPTAYECIICSCIAWEPMECLECNAFACSKCIVKWNQTQKFCPACKDFQGYKKLNRHLK